MLRTLSDAIGFFQETLAQHPERDALAAEQAACTGAPRPYPCFYLGHLHDPTDKTESPPHFVLPPHQFPDDPEGRLAREILGLLAPLDMPNPVTAALSAGGPGSPADLVPSFGLPLSEDRAAAGCTRPLDELLAQPPPDPDAAGMMPLFRQHIEMVKDLTPPSFRINLPDMQGPFNLVHAMAGNEAFTAPLTEPAKFHAFMTRVTDFWIAAYERLRTWVGPERLRPLDRWVRITECSVNLVSEGFYRDHILPHDLRVARRFGAVRIHPCSGRHVFRATLERLPGVMATEAGLMLARMAAPCISVAEALELIGERPIVLNIGQELPADFEQAFEVIRADLALSPTRPRLLFGYTGMYWRKKDRPMIRDLHRRLDALWERDILPLTPGKPK